MYKLKKYLGFPAQLYVGGEKTIGDMTIFQSNEIQKAFFSRAWIYGLIKRSVPVTYVVFLDENPVLFFPALASRNIVELAGSANGICSLCPIYFGSEEAYEEAVLFCLEKMPFKKIIIERLMEESETARIINSSLKCTSVISDKVKNVRINFCEGYSAWYSGLKKSVRQNLRTAYNRCNSDGHDVRFELHRGGEISPKLMKKLVEIYNSRHELRYGVKTSWLKKVYLERFDFSTNSLRDNYAARHGIIYINNEIAGFFSGYYDSGTKSIAIPRLSIDSKFQRYSPGYMLINEAIQFYDGNPNVTCLDLSTGTEKYKMDLGGEVYWKGNYTIRK